MESQEDSSVRIISGQLMSELSTEVPSFQPAALSLQGHSRMLGMPGAAATACQGRRAPHCTLIHKTSAWVTSGSLFFSLICCVHASLCPEESKRQATVQPGKSDGTHVFSFVDAEPRKDLDFPSFSGELQCKVPIIRILSLISLLLTG